MKFRLGFKMAFKSGIIFCTLLLGCLALPKPESDFSQYFEHVDSGARIVGGSVAPEGAHPHMVALTNGVLIRSFFCGGSVIAARTVLTAAHCIEGVFSGGSLLSGARVTVGTNRWNQGGQTYQLSGNATYPHYVSSTIKNDLGVLYTSTPIVMSNLVKPITVSFDFVNGGVAARAAGWGRIRSGGAISAQLLELTLTTIEGDRCVRDVAQAGIDFNMRPRPPAVEPHVELCVHHSVGHGMCNGDSGSALVQVNTGRQIGIVSWGIPCARGAPDMFVRVSAFRNWISQNTRA